MGSYQSLRIDHAPVISAKIGSLESLVRALSAFIRKAQPLPKFTVLPNFPIFSLCALPLSPSLSALFLVRRVADVVHRKSNHHGIVQNVQPVVINFL